MSPREKTTSLTIRMKPAVKESLRRLAARENRSIANMVEVMVLGYAETAGKTESAADRLQPVKAASTSGKARKAP